MKDFILTEERWEQLHDLWFVFGNHGKKHSHGNHRLIQDLVEKRKIGDNVEKQLTDDFEIYSREARIPSYKPATTECYDKIKEILLN